ncbi:MAG: hypothetical protein WDZ77_01205 [Candidatus Pacearchaeota archaeon]
MKRLSFVIFLLYLVFGLYYINLVFEFYPVSKSILAFSQVINLIAGILIIFGGINHLRIGHHRTLIPGGFA